MRSVRHHGDVDRHDEFVSLAKPYTHDTVGAAEIYRVRTPRRAHQPLIIGAVVLLLGVVALLTGDYWIWSRLVLGGIFGLVLVASMALRRLRGEPNVVLLALGPLELLALRVTFLSTHWKVIDEIGHWSLSEIVAIPGEEVLALHLALPNQGVLDLSPLAISRDASQISVALVGSGVEPKADPAA